LYTVADVPYPYTLKSITPAGAITNIGLTGSVATPPAWPTTPRSMCSI
jgi:hypothetical protein